MCLHVCLHVCVLLYFSMCTWICHCTYMSTYSLHVFVYIPTTCICLHTHYMYLSIVLSGIDKYNTTVFLKETKIVPYNAFHTTTSFANNHRNSSNCFGMKHKYIGLQQRCVFRQFFAQLYRSWLIAEAIYTRR